MGGGKKLIADWRPKFTLVYNTMRPIVKKIISSRFQKRLRAKRKWRVTNGGQGKRKGRSSPLLRMARRGGDGSRQGGWATRAVGGLAGDSTGGGGLPGTRRSVAGVLVWGSCWKTRV